LIFEYGIFKHMTTITIPKKLKIGKEPVILLSLKKWKEIEEKLEDLEIYYSERLSKEIAERREENETVPLERLLEKYHI